LATDAKVTAKQAEVLRLVRKHKTSKEIGLILGISHYTVDKHIQTACRTLGVDSRRDAAFMFASDSPPESLVTQSFGIDFHEAHPADTVVPLGSFATSVDSSFGRAREPWNTAGYGGNTLRVLGGISEKVRRSILIVAFSLLILTFGTLFLTVLQSLTEFVRHM
jgi:DNA-binding CsgD family transcriptional regulator